MRHQLIAHWIGGSYDNGRYEVVGRPWISLEGQLWVDSRTGEPLETPDFNNSTITMIGGECDGKVVA